jgi:hypothetical protein
MKFVVFMDAGLGNRIRVINSLLNFLEANNISDYSVKILWVKGNDLNASFEDIFENINRLVTTDVKKGSLNHVVYKLKYYSIFFLLKSFFSSFRNIKNHSQIQINSPGAKTVFLHTYHQFYDIKNNYLTFNSKILSRTKIPSSNYIGIHIRQGDNVQSITNSPTVLFETKIEEILKEKADSLFYLSTDSESLRARFKSLFGERIIVSDSKSINRSTLEGIQDAASDIFILSNADRIIGSYYSSFSEVAAQFRHISLEILKK